MADKQKQLDNVTLENVRIIFRNFSGTETKFNPPGKRNFSVLLDEGIAAAMARDGWNVKTLDPREEGDRPQDYLPVKLNYNTKGRPPRVVMITSRNRTELSENEVNILDWADIINVDLIVRPFSYDINGVTGISAYVQSIYVTIQEDELERKYADMSPNRVDDEETDW